MKLNGLMDYHTHTGVTIDSRETEDACCRRAVELGLSEIAFTNHIMLGNPDFTMSPDSMKRHSENINACRTRFPQLKIRMALEMDYFENREDELAELIDQYELAAGQPFDFVMGAAHYLRGVFFSSKIHAPQLFESANKAYVQGNIQPLKEIYDEYFNLIGKAVESGLFQTIAHIDHIKKHTYEVSPPLAFETYQDSVKELIGILLDNQVAFELNTKGLTFRIKEFFPSQDFLDLYISESKKRKIEPLITLGGDSHQAIFVGESFSEGVQSIKQAGWHRLTGFHQKEPFSIPI